MFPAPRRVLVANLARFWLCAPLLEHVDEHTLERAWAWWEAAYKEYPGFETGSTVLLEFIQEVRLSLPPFGYLSYHIWLTETTH